MKKINVILSTNDYSIFKYIKGNRGLDELNVKRIVDSMTIKYDFTLVILNEFMEVIDGQHRIEACKRLVLPVNYIIIPGLRLKDVVRYNAVQKSWSKINYANSFADSGNQSYKWLKEFMEVYPDFQIGASLSMLTNSNESNDKGGKKVKNAKGKATGKKKSFENGQFQITMADKQKGYEIAAELMKYKPYFKRYNNSVFVKTIIALLKIDKFDNDRMIAQIAKQPTLMLQCSTVGLYKRMLQDLYNYNKAAANRLAFL
jgi:hypothetical protein